MTIQEAFDQITKIVYDLEKRIENIENDKKIENSQKCLYPCLAHHYVGQCFQKDFPNCPCHSKEKPIEFCRYHKNLKPCVWIHGGKIVCSSTPCHIKERE